MIPIFMRSVMPHLTRGVIRSARSVASCRAPVRSVSSCRAPSDDWFESLIRHPIAWIVLGVGMIHVGGINYEREVLLRETHDFAREARDALAREAGEAKLDN